MPGQPPSDNLSDEALRPRLAAGDHAAFDAIYTRYRLMLLSDVHRLMPSFDGHTVDDVVQQVFARFWEHRVRLTKAPHLKAILLKMARDFAVDALRDRKRSGGSPLQIGMPADCGQPLTQLQRKELGQQIQQACSILTQAQRTALELKLSGLSAKEVAQRVGCSPRAIERRDEAARQRLRNHLAPENDDS